MELEKDFPVAVTLRFKSEEERDLFMGQLSDGWGENHCSLRWPWQQYPEEVRRTREAFRSQPAFGVELPEEELEQAARRKEILRRILKK